ncbi:helicase HerA-like domain-containing protein [Mangrovivirga cuniculi]|uniref:ATPase n=1 Tax=Mangrovivirga cuniculi TaxID=2715131 RepID=A0A4D7JK39_9BACT|nr:helicase HerA-like domain-containing protein [Mangrovivirga cuniculi]QCK15067.1 ATPase [Mangrovivirga cuniculi]
MKEKFISDIQSGYYFKGKDFIIGAGVYDNEIISDAKIKIPLSTINRHGLISGATGTGKTKSLQVFAECLSDNGVPVLMMDIKGDLSGIAKPGEVNNHITTRHEAIDLEFKPSGFPVELLSLTGKEGVKLRATVSEFGPIVLSKMLNLNDTQSSILSVIFQYADKNGLPLLDLKDLKRLLRFITEEGKEEIQKEYGRLSSASIGTIMRKVIGLEQEGAEQFFGEPSFDIKDLLHKNDEGKGQISVLRVNDIQDKPKLYSSFMLSLLAEIFSTFPEKGDSDKPRLVMFIDEAHLLFKEAGDELLEQIDTVIKLIRSKGVGIYFCTQSPTDIPESVLSQLGLRIQHALRAVTAKDRKAIRSAAENFPLTEYYETDKILTSLGVGQALITVLNEKGIPTPLVVTHLRAPASRMNVLKQNEIEDLLNKSDLVDKYNETVDRESAYELLEKKLFTEEKQIEESKGINKPQKPLTDESVWEELSKNTMVRQMGRTLIRELSRGLLGAVSGKKTSSGRKGNSIFDLF